MKKFIFILVCFISVQSTAKSENCVTGVKGERSFLQKNILNITRFREVLNSCYSAGARMFTGLAGFSPETLNYVDVKTFGAVGDGVTNDLVAVQAAAEQACVNGLNLYFSPGTYNLGDLSLEQYAISIHDVNGMVISGNKAMIVCRSTGSNADNQTKPPRIFQVSNSHNLTFNGLQFFDKGYSNSATYRGAYGIYIPVTSGDVTNIEVVNVHARSMLGLMYRAYSTSRFENIDVRNTLVERGYYGLILNDPRNLHTSSFRTDSVKRALFLTGGQFINADILSNNHQEASAEVLLKCYGIPLKNIRIHYRSDSSQSAGNAFVSLEQQGDLLGEFLIDNVDIDVDCSGSSVGYPVAIRSYNGSGVLETNTTKHWDNIHIRGLSAGTPGRQVQVFSTQSIPGLIEVDRQLDPNNFFAPYFPGFVRKEGNTWNYTITGPLTTATQFIDLSKFPGFPGKVGTIKVRSVMIDNTSSGATTNMNYQEDLLFVAVANNGNVNIISQTNLQKKSSTTTAVATATYSASANGINVTFSSYGNSLSTAYLTVEPFQ
ncbi:glycosyl hydrolase family 28-related protein [Chitinophaga sp. RAB17]|uniref:glycosyl hydrolase family 28-related protein n=1 Tax=Chitinophaga sp. RAB17 TaxID=3233049 RepID=UPI003F8DB9A1